jgi:cysteine-rich repeat protein
MSVSVAFADPLTQNADLDLQGQGLALAEGGIGLTALGAGSETITIDIGGPVEKAFLYWVGRDVDCPEDGSGNCLNPPPQPYGDQEMIFDGNAITGEFIGAEENVSAFSGRKFNVGYRYDVTDIVLAAYAGPGTYNFTIEDGDLNNNLFILSGAGLLVAYTDESDPLEYAIQGADGLDFAWVNDVLPHARVTVPVSFTYAPIFEGRPADLILFTADAEPDRPDRILFSNSPPLNNVLNETDGPEWDTVVVNFTIPGGDTETTVEVVSPPEYSNSDSIIWTLGAVRIPFPVCGDGVVSGDVGETCDPPGEPAGEPNECREDCTFCGDGILDDGEECDDGNNVDGDGCDAYCMIEEMDFYGCTPGYWKQEHHFGNWVDYSPSDVFDDVFGVEALGDATLLDALWARGGGLYALARHATAALLNTANPDVNYMYTEEEVIALVQ